MKIKTALITRTYLPTSTPGKLELFDEDGCKRWECATLELPWKNNQQRISCIPSGKYRVIPRHSVRFGNHLHITGVPGRSYILIHVGNYTKDIEGCILVGKKHLDLNGDGITDLNHSRITMNELLDIAPNGFELEIKPNP